MPLFPCGHCRGLNPSSAIRCMHCGQLFPKPAPAGPEAELKGLEGEWQMTTLWHDGREVAGDIVWRYRLEVGGGWWVVRHDNLRSAFRVQFDPTATPHALDLTDALGELYRGIYELAGDDLRVCRSAQPDGPRPTALDPAQGLLAFWRRASQPVVTV